MTTHPEEDPPSPETDGSLSNIHNHNGAQPKNERAFIKKIVSFFKPHKNDNSLRETIEEYIENEKNTEEDPLLTGHEKALLSNVLELHDMYAKDVMVPRADIIGIPSTTTRQEMFSLLAEKQYSRFPVYKDTLDNIVGSVHIKDILASIARGEEFDMHKLTRDIPIVSPAMHVLDLLTQMRITRKHSVLVVDEFGGIDGLITMSDLIEAIVGEIDDEHNLEIHPEISLQIDGSLLADARYDIDEFEELYGLLLTEEEREETETLGGLMFILAGRVPARGEVIKHSSGMVFEIADADPRRVKQLRIRNIPQQKANSEH
ncbi:MAG: hemolysin family protein [Alphaproteobacteria bacterium]